MSRSPKVQDFKDIGRMCGKYLMFGRKSKMKTVFVSYCWADQGSAIVLEKALCSLGLRTVFDVHDLKYKDSIRGFMEQIRSCDFALMVLSKDYVRSLNCMTEAINVFENVEFVAKVLPVMVGSPDIFSPEKRLDLVEFWSDFAERFRQSSSKLNLSDLGGTVNDLKRIEKIGRKMSEFLDVVADMKVDTLDSLLGNNLQSIVDCLQISPSVVEIELLRWQSLRSEEEKLLHLLRLRKRFPTDSRVLTQAGEYYADQHWFDVARVYYEDALDTNPSNDEAAIGLAFTMTQCGAPQAASDLCTTVVKKRPINGHAYEVLGLRRCKTISYRSNAYLLGLIS